MSPLILLLIIVLAPVIGALLLRFNAGIVFMSICMGDVLVRYVPHSSAAALPQTSNLSGSSWQLILLLAPAVIVTVLTFRSIKGGSILLANLLPALGSGFLLLLLVQPLLPRASSQSLIRLSQWQQFIGFRPVIVAASAAASLFFVWYQRKKSGKPTKSKD